MNGASCVNEHRRYAVLIGVSEYEEGVGNLPYARNDVVRLRSVLQTIPAFSSDRIYLLATGVDPGGNIPVVPPTRANILHRLKYVCDEAGPDDLIFIYFAGHGTELSETPYLLTADTKMDVLKDTAVTTVRLNFLDVDLTH